MPRKKRPKSKRKQDAIKRNTGIAAWRRAAAEYLLKGKFIHLPKVGTPEHAKMVKRQQQLIPVVKKEIDKIIADEMEEKRKARILNQQKRIKEVARHKRRKERNRIQLLKELPIKKNKTEIESDEEDVVTDDTDDEKAMEIQKIDNDQTMFYEKDIADIRIKDVFEDGSTCMLVNVQNNETDETDEWM
jgi:hypothetical protein